MTDMHDKHSRWIWCVLLAVTGLSYLGARADPSRQTEVRQLDRGALDFRERLDRERQGVETNAWWGKPMAPLEFWEGKTVWLDETAILAAKARGRRLPPPAFDDPSMSLAHYSRLIEDASKESSDAAYQHERRFWTKWVPLLHRPPSDILAFQEGAAEECFRAESSKFRALLERRAALAADEDLQGRLHRVQRRALDVGIPHESVDAVALRWAYILAKRKEYSDRVEVGMEDGRSVSPQFAAALGVAPEAVVRPLADHDLQEANTWKARYVARLARDGADSSYIAAYCRAWNLDMEAVLLAARQRDESPETVELNMPECLRKRTANMKARHETKVLGYLQAGEEGAARILAKRYCLDRDLLTTKAQQED